LTLKKERKIRSRDHWSTVRLCWIAFMINPRPGEVYWVDLGMKAKVLPVMVVSREDAEAERALSVCVPLTTEIRGQGYEV
jgi:hypothetical protein